MITVCVWLQICLKARLGDGGENQGWFFKCSRNIKLLFTGSESQRAQPHLD